MIEREAWFFIASYEKTEVNSEYLGERTTSFLSASWVSSVEIEVLAGVTGRNFP